MKKQCPFIVLALLLLSACGQTPRPVVELIGTSKTDSFSFGNQSKIIGEVDFIKVKKDGSNVDHSLRPYLDAFGIMASGAAGSCSVTHLGNGYVLTAGHCILPLGKRGVLMNRNCSQLKIYWGYRGSPDTGTPSPAISLVSTCANVVYAELSDARDFAIFRVDEIPSVSVPISKAEKRPSTGTKLTIFGYPQGRPLEWSQYCKLASHGSVPSLFGYQCDTDRGNSGSAVIAITAAGNPLVIGIHNVGDPNDTVPLNWATYLTDAIQAMEDSSAKFDLISAIHAPKTL